MEERRREEQEEEARRGEARRGEGARGGPGGPGRTGLAASSPLRRLPPAGPRLAACQSPGARLCRWGHRAPGRAGPPSAASPRPAPPGSAGLGPLPERRAARAPAAPGPARPAAPRRTGRPGGRWLPQRPPGLLGSSLLGAVREGAGPARREGAFKATHTPPSAERGAREPRGLAIPVTGKRPALAGLEAGSPGRTPVDLGARKGSGLGAYSIPSYLSISPHCPFPHCGAPRASLLAKFPASRPSPLPHHTSNYSQTLP